MGNKLILHGKNNRYKSVGKIATIFALQQVYKLLVLEGSSLRVYLGRAKNLAKRVNLNRGNQHISAIVLQLNNLRADLYEIWIRINQKYFFLYDKRLIAIGKH